MRFHLPALCLILICTGCAGFSPKKGERLDLPVAFVIQDSDALCGLASADMVARYWKRSLKPEAVAALKAQAKVGDLSAEELAEALGQSGLDWAIFEGSAGFEETGLKHHLKLRRPLIVLLGDAESRHFVVVKGFSSPPQALEVLDPGKGELRYAEKDFLTHWKASQSMTLLALPKE